MLYRLCAVILFGLLSAAPAAHAKSKHMQPSADQAPVPAPGKALVVFFRDSFIGSAIQASVYDAPDGEDTFIGIVSNKTKVAYQAEPGQHRFMVIAENADFVDATLDAGKTYYLLISPRPGVWKARFSLLPIHNDPAAERNLQSEDFNKWMKDSAFVENTASSLEWYQKNKASVGEKKADYLEKWNRMLPEDRAVLTLHAADGVDGGQTGAP